MENTYHAATNAPANVEKFTPSADWFARRRQTEGHDRRCLRGVEPGKRCVVACEQPGV